MRIIKINDTTSPSNDMWSGFHLDDLYNINDFDGKSK
ncbi:hypothetical protein DJ90_6642 [Paenibacillus macerans]|uniref:Uncharacterized protein n=1 Tax=Paenibacillus macerans TaxID=44252 RepID=A0A090ZN41_PAEMA|nr:hypothetical protein DJ90_6642 [Paenibacillus macerans]